MPVSALRATFGSVNRFASSALARTKVFVSLGRETPAWDRAGNEVRREGAGYEVRREGAREAG